MRKTIVLTKKELHQLIQESIDEVIADNPQIYDNLLYEMSNISRKTTGLDFIVWVQTHMEGPAAGQHNLPRLKFQVNGNYIPVSIEREPRLLGGVTYEQLNISSKQYKKLILWIQTNYNALISYWNGNIATDELISDLKSV